jgi:hypothetical protein
MQFFRPGVVVGLLTCIYVSSFSYPTKAAEPEGWGHLKGQFIYDGPPPTPSQIVVPQPFRNQPIVDESLLVHAETGGIANVVIYLRTKAAPVHPDFHRPPPPVRLTIAAGRIRPHVSSIRLGQRLRIQNLDVGAYNINIAPILDTPDNPVIQPGNFFERVFNRSQTIPQPISCNIHPWVRAYILPRDNPYMAITDDHQGRFEIRNLPAGELEFQAWHESVGYLAAQPEWEMGRFKVDIRPAQTADLGTIHVDPKLLRKR